jgi:hypothetical protein
MIFHSEHQSPMKKIAALSLLLAVAGILNVGCSASASIKPASATKTPSHTQVAYTTTPSE